MTEKDFWKLYNQKYKGHTDIIIENRPIGGDGGFFKMGIYKNKDSLWCIEETVERSDTPRQITYKSEKEAFCRFLEKVHYHSDFKDEPLPTKTDIKEETSWLSRIISIVTNPNTEHEELR